MNQKLVIVILCGMVVGMILNTPVLFISDVFVGGLVMAVLSGVIGHFAMKRNQKDVEIKER